MAGKQQTVLVVEDEASIASFVAAYLKNAGYTIVEGNGWDASAQALCQERCDAIVFDVSIESDDALAACQQIKKVSKKPLILLSGNSSMRAGRRSHLSTTAALLPLRLNRYQRCWMPLV